jgi:primase-polymerase (primpol)-like protein
MTVAEIAVPDTMAELDQWLCWRRENNTKVPYAIDGRRASSTDPHTWCPFEEAIATWRRFPRRYAGVGFVFTKNDRLAGIDIDNCLDAHGYVKEWAQKIVGHFAVDTYTEISPSGSGLKIFTRGTIPANVAQVRVGDGGIEMYDHARYFTVTGHVFRGAPLERSQPRPKGVVWPSDAGTRPLAASAA